MRLDQLQIVLVLADELHFGRTAERLHVSQARVSKDVAAVERRIGGALFHRTSRRVALTALGRRFVEDVGPAYRGLLDSLDQLAWVDPEIRVGFVPTTGTTVLSRLMRAFDGRHPEFKVQVSEVGYQRAFASLDEATIDVLVWWRIDPARGVKVGPAIDTQARVAVMSTEHPLAGRDHISVGEVELWARATNVPRAIVSALLPDIAPDGSPIRKRPVEITTMGEYVDFLLRTGAAHATVASFTEYVNRKDLVSIPIVDLPPLDLVLFWRASRENDAIRALAQVAVELNSREP